MFIGYARISTVHQTLDMQIDALKHHGVDERNIYKDIMSSSFIDRPELKRMLAFVKPGDTVCVWKYDRIYRSPKHLLQVSDFFKENNIDFVSLTEKIDTSTPIGKFYFSLTASISQFERDLIQERVLLGVRAAQARGVRFGRPEVLTLDQKQAIRLLANQSKPISHIARMFHVSRCAIYNALKEN